MFFRKIKKFLWIFTGIICLFVGLFYVALCSMQLDKIGYRENSFHLSQTHCKTAKIMH